MVMKALRDGAAGGVMKFILFGLLIMAVGGLVMMDVGGFFRGGISRTDISKVGSETITAMSFDRTVRRTLSRLGMGPEEAYRLGYINEILNNEIRASLVYQTARDAGIHVSRTRIAEEVNKIVEPLVNDERSPQEVLDQILLNQGMSEMEFVKGIEGEVTGELLSSTIKSGFSVANEFLTKDLYAYQNEERDIDYIVFPDAELKDVALPTEEQIRMMYEATKESYAEEERRTASVLVINDEKLKQTIDLSEEEIRQVYEEEISLYTVPEQRKFEQAILKTEEEALKVFEKAKAGVGLKAAVEDVTGGDHAYLQAQYFEKEGLLPEISQVVFSASKGSVLEPIKTALGWHVISLQDIKAPKIKTFESVRQQLENDLKQVKLSDQLYALANNVDDMFAGGAGIEEVAEQVDMDRTDIIMFNRYGQGEDGKDALEAFKDERNLILETAFELLEGETSAVMEMSNGKFMAVHVSEIRPKYYQPLEEVREKLERQWMIDQRALENRMRVIAFLSTLETTGQTLGDFAKEKGRSIKKARNLKREEEPPKPLEPSSLGPVFDTNAGGYTTIDIEGGTILAQVTAARIPDDASIQKKDIAELHEQQTRGGQREALITFFEAKRQDFKILVNQDLLEKLYGPESGSN